VASVFTKIIRGDLPGRFVWRDDEIVAFLTIQPLRPGHTLVVPVEEVDHWTDLEAGLCGRLMQVAQQVGQAQRKAFRPRRIGLAIAGLEVPHVHLHVTPLDTMRDLDFGSVDPSPSDASQDDAAERIRAALREMGCAEVAE